MFERERPSKHYSVATSTTETPIHRLSHFTGFHEIRSPGSHGATGSLWTV